MRRTLAAATAFALMTVQPGAAFTGPDNPQPGDRVTGDWFASRSPVLAPHGAAATAQPLATQIAIDILRAGGSAVDAAIAANAALGLMEPVGCGIGGDLFALVYDPETNEVYGLNASGRSPMGLSLQEMRAAVGEDGRIPPFGALAVSTPGAVSGWFALHERFGRLEMSEILAPAIAYAEEGFPVTEVIAYYWDANRRRLEQAYEEGMLEEIDNARATYWPDGRAPAAGEIFRNRDLANTYRLIAEGGREAFYEGEIAEAIDAYMREIGGHLTAEDLAAHEAEWVAPASVNYRGYDVWELPPNTQGIAALQMLQVLEGYDLAAMGYGSADSLHVQIEAKRLAFEDRARFYSDPSFSPAPVDALVSDDYADARRALISMESAMAEVSYGDPVILEDGDTTYLTVADESGMMVSLIQSNYRGMGSGLAPTGLGFMLQDRGELFALEDGHPNLYQPGRRPFHTIIPAMVTREGEAWLSFGVMGGGMQPQGHVQILVNMIDYGMNVQEAGDAARWRHEGTSEPTGAPAEGVGVVYVESGISPEVRAELEARGHVLADGDGGFGGYQAILRDPETGVYWAASEMRKDGAAMGY